ncbi:hypothetical protein [Halosimplex halophilum]|uniref:hypothetical protein n=1 Tax=Halosimplex halophilum TaxID=2559572 RepID=UPI0014355FDE|nr:hypothetical protein [Halosimplex halophilum]
MYLVLQLAAWVDVIPGWVPPVTIAVGFCLISLAMGKQYFEGLFDGLSTQAPVFTMFFVTCLTVSIGGATYVTIQQEEFLLMFVFFLFVSGRMVQGAIAARIIQKVLDFFIPIFSSGGGDTDLSLSALIAVLKRAQSYIWSKLRTRLIIFVVTGLISFQTALSIAAVYVIGSGETADAVRRFWAGVFFLLISGMVFDFRYFAHKISWTATIGLILTVTGAFLYNPLEFSAYTGLIAPYLENPLPDWLRWPLGIIGFIAGVFMWAGFYLKEG